MTCRTNDRAFYKAFCGDTANSNTCATGMRDKTVWMQYGLRPLLVSPTEVWASMHAN
jgi:hypothetical protein